MEEAQTMQIANVLTGNYVVDLLLQDMLSQTLMRPQGDPLLQEKWRGDPCGEGRVPQLGLPQRKQNLPHQVGKPAQSPMLTCQVRLSNIGNKEIQTSGGLVLGSPPVSEKKPLFGPSGHLSNRTLKYAEQGGLKRGWDMLEQWKLI